jgi:excisionase family DNA binding protein
MPDTNGTWPCPDVRLSITPAEAASALGCSLSMVYKLIRDAKLEGYTIGRLKRIWLDCIVRYAEENPLTGKSQAGRKQPVRPAPQSKPRGKRPPVTPRPGPFRFVD